VNLIDLRPLRAAVAALVVTGACAVPAAAQEPAPRATFTEKGLFAPGDGPLKLLAATDTVPLKLGTRFGFCADISGLVGEEKLAFYEVVRHPLMTTARGIEEVGWNSPRWLVVERGRSRWCVTHTFKELWELVPGTWRFTLSGQGGDVVVGEFTAVKAGE
jgi:hypothetical protein